jgi:hypothetical protein
MLTQSPPVPSTALLRSPSDCARNPHSVVGTISLVSWPDNEDSKPRPAGQSAAAVGGLRVLISRNAKSGAASLARCGAAALG